MIGAVQVKEDFIGILITSYKCERYQAKKLGNRMKTELLHVSLWLNRLLAV